MFGIGKAGSDAYDRGRVYQQTGSWEVADAVGSYLKPESEQNAGDKLSRAKMPELAELLKLK